MEKIALDVVLFLSKEMTKICIDINSLAVQRGETSIQLGTSDYFPHISLLMGVVQQKDTAEVVTTLENMEFPLSLSLKAFEVAEYPALRVQKTPAIVQLHEEVISRVEKSFVSDVAQEDFFTEDKNDIDDEFMHHVQNYISLHSYQNFDPHITIHTTNIHPYSPPLNFSASHLAVCQLGEKGTCRKILYAKKLETS